LLFYLQAFARLILFWLPVSVGGAIAATFVIAPLYAAIGAVAWLFVLFVAALWVPSLAFDRWAYALRPSDLVISRGVWLRTVTAIPVSRIQHVDTRQGPIEQLLGLARVQIHTASGVGGDGVIPGLTHADADALRDELIRVSGDGGV
jgi:membrane protein YdbS with pleckstrin-like domain